MRFICLLTISFLSGATTNASMLWMPQFEWQNQNSNLVVAAEVVVSEPQKCHYRLKLSAIEGKEVWRDQLNLQLPKDQIIDSQQTCQVTTKVKQVVVSTSVLPALNLAVGDKGLFMLHTQGNYLNHQQQATVLEAHIVGLDLGFFKLVNPSEQSTNIQLQRILPQYFAPGTNFVATEDATSADLNQHLLQNSQQRLSLHQLEQRLVQP